jgi:hypothetical protein
MKMVIAVRQTEERRTNGRAGKTSVRTFEPLSILSLITVGQSLALTLHVFVTGLLDCIF